VIREYENVALPRWHRQTPLTAGADRVLAETIVGIELCLDGDEDELNLPSPRHQPLGRCSSARAAGDHVLVTIAVNMEAMGARELVAAIDENRMTFGLWGHAVTKGQQIVLLRPTSVRIIPRRLREGPDGRGGLGEAV
jgi:hypothetical protein